MGRPLLVALPLVVALLAYPVWMLVAGPQHATSSANPTVNPYHNDLLSFVVPGPLQHDSFGLHALAHRLMVGPRVTLLPTTSNQVEVDGFIGVAVVVFACVLVWRSRRSPRMQLAGLLFLVTAVLSLGPSLVVDAHATNVRLPFLLFTHVPLVDNILPVRFSLEMFGCLAAIIAFGLDDVHRQQTKPWSSHVLAGALLVVLVVSLLPQWPYATPGQESTLPTAVRAAIPAGDPVAVTYPYPTLFTDPSQQPLGWQMESGYNFRLLGGYAHFTGPDGADLTLPTRMSPSGLQAFLSGLSLFYGPRFPVGPKLESITRTTLSKYDVRLVIVDRSARGSGQVLKLFTATLGPPTVSSGRFALWSIGAEKSHA